MARFARNGGSGLFLGHDFIFARLVPRRFFMNTTSILPSKFDCPRNLVPHVQKVFAGEYAPPVEIPAPNTILDLGANVGAFTLWAKARWPEARVYAYEPVESTFHLFQANVAGLAGVFAHHLAVSASAPVDFNDYEDIALGKNNCGEASFYDLGGQTRETELVERVHPLNLASAEFVKLDTEGCELEILQNLDLTLTNVIALEWHRAADRKKIHQLLTMAAPDFICVKDQKTAPERGLLLYVRGSLAGAKAWRKLFLAVPFDHGLTFGFNESYIRLLMQPPLPLKRGSVFGDSLVPRARNALIAEFMDSFDCTHLLFIDTDLKFSTAQVLRICSHDVPIVGGCYAKKIKGPAQWVLNTDPDFPQPEASGLQRVRFNGTGFLCIRKDVPERMIAACPELAYQPDHRPGEVEHDLFSVGVYRAPGVAADVPGRYLSEDWYFCQRALDLGIPVYADTKVVPWHTGEMDFPSEATTPPPSPQPQGAADGDASAGIIPAGPVGEAVQAAVAERA